MPRVDKATADRMVRELVQRGVNAGHERIRPSWKRKSLRPIYKRPYHVTSEFDHAKPVAQNVWNRRFDGCATNQAWVANINYVSTGKSWLYLEWVMDLGGRKIVGWPMSERMKAILYAMRGKWRIGGSRPAAGLIMHSDRGVQYASDTHRKLNRVRTQHQSCSSMMYVKSGQGHWTKAVRWSVERRFHFL